MIFDRVVIYHVKGQITNKQEKIKRKIKTKKHKKKFDILVDC